MKFVWACALTYKYNTFKFLDVLMPLFLFFFNCTQVRARFDKDYPGEATQMSVKMGYFVQKELPAWVFDQFSAFGASEAKQRRKADKKARKDALRAGAAERDAAAAGATTGAAAATAVGLAEFVTESIQDQGLLCRVQATPVLHQRCCNLRQL
jgi:hypothetical protein